MNELSILLIEDDKIACDEIQNYINFIDDMHMVGITDNANDALEMVKSLLPDVILLDLELHRGGGNGIIFLQKLNQMRLTIKPFILVTTNNASPITFASVHKLGADFILAKYESGYSPQYIVELIHIMKDIILSHNVVSASPQQELSPDKQEHNLTQRIQRELHLIGISPKAIGFQYLIDAISLTAHNSKENVSYILSQKYGKSKASIERAMENAINRAWQTSNPDDLLKYYTARIRSDRGVPTLMEFIHYYAKQLSL